MVHHLFGKLSLENSMKQVAGKLRTTSNRGYLSILNWDWLNHWKYLSVIIKDFTPPHSHTSPDYSLIIMKAKLVTISVQCFITIAITYVYVLLLYNCTMHIYPFNLIWSTWIFQFPQKSYRKFSKNSHIF